MNSPAYDLWSADQTPNNMATIIEELQPTINSEVQRYSGPKPLLRSKAKVLATNAVRTYDPNRGTQLRSWLITQMQPLSRYSHKLRPVHASEVAVRQAAEVNRLREELSDTLGREPELTELADETGISVMRIKKLRETVRSTTPESSFVTEEGATNLPATEVADSLDTATEAVYDSLSDRDKTIYDWKTGGHGKPTLANKMIAVRLGVTPALISQRSQQIAEQIRSVAQRGI